MKQSKIPDLGDIKLGDIDRPNNPDRMDIDKKYISELARSIREMGLLQPILLNKKDKRYEIVFGERRYLACVELGHKTIKAHIKEYTENELRLVRAIENLQRVNLSVIEEAKIYQDLHDKFKMSWDAIGQKAGKTPGLVKRRYDLLFMPDCLVNAMHKGEISYSVAEQLMRIKNVSRIEYLLQYAVENGATRDVVRRWVDEEEADVRQKATEGDDQGGFKNPIENKPVYFACDLCVSPTTLGEETVMRVCPACVILLKKSLE